MNEDGVPTSAESSVIRDVVESRETTVPAAGRVSRPRIVLADDNADLRDYLSRILSERYDVEAVPDGEAALAAARAGPVDLALIDLRMPGLDGYALLERLPAGIPAIVITSVDPGGLPPRASGLLRKDQLTAERLRYAINRIKGAADE